MARAIDGDKLVENLRLIATCWSISPYVSKENHNGAIDMLREVEREVKEMPTLTPQNEPLTLDELREMDGEPVWVDDKKTWALLQVWDDKNIDVVFPMPKGCFHAKSVNGRKIYRRPPEGET